ncbi:hypothetical protein BH23ACT2_BH23ACT2_21520 [soil metagenome]
MDPTPVADREPVPTDGEPAAATGDAATDPMTAPAPAIPAADLAAIQGLQRRHARTSTDNTPPSTDDQVVAGPVLAGPAETNGANAGFAPSSGEATAGEARCPIPGVASIASNGTCPVLPGPTGVRRSPADLVVRRLLRIQDRPVDLSDGRTYKTFQRSMGISAVRCTLTYVIFPFVLPALNFATGFGPWLGVLIGSLALVCDTLAIRRFFAVDHKYRWHFSAVALAVMALLTVLLVQDVSHIVTSSTR